MIEILTESAAMKQPEGTLTQLLQVNGTKTSLICCLTKGHNASLQLKTTLDAIKTYKIDSILKLKPKKDLTNKATCFFVFFKMMPVCR